MSFSTWHFITPCPSLGWLFRNMVLPRFVPLWQAMLRRHNDMRSDCLDIVTRWLLYQYCALCTHLQHSTNSDYKLHTSPCGRNRWNLFDDVLRSSCRLRLCYYVVGSPLLPPFVRPGRARDSDRRRADDLPAGHASAVPSAFSSGGPTQPQHTTRPLRTPVVIV